MKNIPTISFQTQIVDPETGRPTLIFIELINFLRDSGLGSLTNVSIPVAPADGATLTYSAAEGKWIAS